MSQLDRRAHWDQVYAGHAPDEVSWFQARPATSLALIGRSGAGPGASIVDVGGGASLLVDALLDAGFQRLTVLDVSENALSVARQRLGSRAGEVTWLASDVTRWRPATSFDVWHDRAVFHFLVEPKDRQDYRAAMTAALKPGGQAIIGTFASDGPDRCSGLPVEKYEPESLAAALGAGFQLIDSLHEEHLTPSGKAQRFQFSRFRKAWFRAVSGDDVQRDRREAEPRHRNPERHAERERPHADGFDRRPRQTAADEEERHHQRLLRDCRHQVAGLLESGDVGHERRGRDSCRRRLAVMPCKMGPSGSRITRNDRVSYQKS